MSASKAGRVPLKACATRSISVGEGVPSDSMGRAYPGEGPGSAPTLLANSDIGAILRKRPDLLVFRRPDRVPFPGRHERQRGQGTRPPLLGGKKGMAPHPPGNADILRPRRPL